MPAVEALPHALHGIADALESAQDPWWVIGSAAMALHGAPIAVRDIDLLLSRGDARRLLEARGLPVLPGTADGIVQSEIFASWPAPPFTVELFAGFRVATAAGWREIVPRTRVPLPISGSTVWVPDVLELIELGRLFGRHKDRGREPLLLSLLRAPPDLS
jgi:hypothetical protein